MNAPKLDPAKIAPVVQASQASFHANIVEAVISTVARDHLVVVGMAQNPFVRKARKLLDEAKVAYTYLEYGSYFSQWKERLAIKLWAGFPTFPMVFIDGVLEGGHAELMELQRAGRLAPSA